MLVLVSPAKTLDYDSELKADDFSVASHLSDSELLVKELQKREITLKQDYKEILEVPMFSKVVLK